MFPRFYLIAIQITDVGANSKSRTRARSVTITFNHQAIDNDNSLKRTRAEENESARCGPNDNALVAFWHPARSEKPSPFSLPFSLSLSLSLSLLFPATYSTGYIPTPDPRSGGLIIYVEPRRRRALNSNETIRPLEKARQSTNAGRRAQSPRPPRVGVDEIPNGTRCDVYEWRLQAFWWVPYG